MRPLNNKPLSKEDESNLHKLRELMKLDKDKKPLSVEQRQTLALLKNLYYSETMFGNNKENASQGPAKPSTRSRR